MSRRSSLVLAFGLGSLTWPLWRIVAEEIARRTGAIGYAFGAK